MYVRKVPEWLKRNENILQKSLHNNELVTLRSNINNIGNGTGGGDAADGGPKRTLRSAGPLNSNENITSHLTVNQTAIESLPYIEYTGGVKYCKSFEEIAFACDDLLYWVNSHKTNEIIPIAFDMEWPFTFQTGPGRTAVIQLCADLNLCYILHLTKITKLPATLCVLLKHDMVQLHGVNIKNDFRKLERDFPEIQVQKCIDQCVDLGPWCNKVHNTSGRWSMERLVLYLCKLRINKDKAVRMSRWHVMPLTKVQQIYAAIDVYISQVMYYELKKAEEKKLMETYGFAEVIDEKELADLEINAQ